MKDALDVHRTLLEHETAHRIIQLRRQVATADELPEMLGVPKRCCLIVRMYETDGWLAALIVHAGRVPSAPAVAAATAARKIIPASTDLVNTVTGYAAGLVSPVLLPSSVRVLIDQRVVNGSGTHDEVYTATGGSGTALCIRAVDLFACSGARPVVASVPVPSQATRPPLPLQRSGRAPPEPHLR